MNKIYVVDDQDNVVSVKEFGTLDKGEIHRASALWVWNEKGEVLLAKRHRSKKYDPLKWGPSAAGTIEEGEDYYSNIIKEAEEELGLKDIKPVKVCKNRVSGSYDFFFQIFKIEVKSDTKFILQEDEVEEVKWWKVDDLKKEIKKNPDKFIYSFEKIVEVSELN